MLLPEIAITPGVFDEDFYGNPEFADSTLQRLKEQVLEVSLVRDLSGGKWSRHLEQRVLHPMTKEFLKFLRINNRLCVRPAELSTLPSSEEEWCHEAEKSHIRFPLDGYLTARVPRGSQLAAPIKNPEKASWWSSIRKNSVSLVRDLKAYESALSNVLAWARSLVFIDPYLLDPVTADAILKCKRRYSHFIILLRRTRKRSVPPPYIELHRKVRIGSGRDKHEISPAQWEHNLKNLLGPVAKDIRTTIHIHLWDDFGIHDRYLLTDLVNLTIPNGFDVSSDKELLTTWTRFDREDAERIRRQFVPGCPNRKHIHQFEVR